METASHITRSNGEFDYGGNDHTSLDLTQLSYGDQMETASHINQFDTVS